MNLGRNATVFQEGKKETEFMKTEKVGASKGVTQFFWKSCDWCWQAVLHCAIHVAYVYCQMKILFPNKEFSDTEPEQSQVPIPVGSQLNTSV